MNRVYIRVGLAALIFVALIVLSWLVKPGLDRTIALALGALACGVILGEALLVIEPKQVKHTYDYTQKKQQDEAEAGKAPAEPSEGNHRSGE